MLEAKEVPEQDSLDSLVRRYFPMVYSTCMRITRNRHDAEDAAQAVFLCLANQIKQNVHIRAHGPWLYQVACRTSMDLYRRRKSRRLREVPAGEFEYEGPPPKDPGAALDMDDLRPKLVEALNALSPRYRLPLILQYFGGLTHEELAKELGCTRTLLRVRLHRGHKMLRGILERRGISLAGTSLSIALTAVIQDQVSDSLITSTIGVGHHAISFGTQACALPSDVIAVATHAAARPARIKFVVIAFAAGLSGLGFSTPLLAKLVRELPWIHHPLNLLEQLPRPSLTVPLPRLSDASSGPTLLAQSAPSSANPANPVNQASSRAAAPVSANPAASNYTSALAQRLEGPNVAPLPMVSPPQFHFDPNAGAAATPRYASAAAVAASGQPRLAAEYVLPKAADYRTSVSPDYPLAMHYGSSGSTQRDSLSRLLPPSTPGASVPPPVTPPATDSSAKAFPGIARVTVTVAQGVDSVWSHTSPNPHGAVVSDLVLGDARNGGHVTQMSLSTSTPVYDYATAAGSMFAAIRTPAVEVKSQYTQLVNNGQVVSWGAGNIRDLRQYDGINSSIENPTDGVNGWFAIGGGRVTLPAIELLPGTHRYNWGEAAGDNVLDMINSVAMDITSQTQGSATLSLLGTDNALVPDLPEGHHFAGIWNVVGMPKSADTLGVTIRYDTTFLDAKGLSESYVKLWAYDNGVWTHLTDGVYRDMNSHLISGQIPTDSTFFAVSTPEPGSAALLAFAGAALLLKRRRRGRSHS